MTFGKVDVVHYLADKYRYRRYFEFATSITGYQYSKIDRDRFIECERLLYMCPKDFSDDLKIDYRCLDVDISSALNEIRMHNKIFDVMLVDPYHSYEASLRDLSAAYSLLAPGGAMVVHDCLPPNESVAGAVPTPNEWCGLTYKAFLDFVLGRTDLRYITIDVDYGCGIIRKVSQGSVGRVGAYRRRRQERLIERWRRCSSDDHTAWRFFEANRKALLRLKSVKALLANRHHLGEPVAGGAGEPVAAQPT